MKHAIRRTAAWSLLLVAVSLVAAGGCNTGATAGPDDSGDFAPGAFPPTLSDTEYHEKAWTRTDCLTCHEGGANNSPVTEHTSLPPIAKSVKCRSCHVFIRGSKPIQ